MTCPACTKAAERACYEFRYRCPGCAARSVAHLPQYREARNRKDSRHRPYVLVLEAFGVQHEDVVAAVANDVALRDELQRIRSRRHDKTEHSERLLTAHRARTAAEFKREADGG